MSDAYETAINACKRYHREVVDSVLSGLRENLHDMSNPERLDEQLSSDVEGHECIIYTGRAWVFCVGTNNDEAYYDELDEEPATIEARAAWALMADVRESAAWHDMVEAIENGTVAEYLAAVANDGGSR